MNAIDVMEMANIKLDVQTVMGMENCRLGQAKQKGQHVRDATAAKVIHVRHVMEKAIKHVTHVVVETKRVEDVRERVRFISS